MDIRGIIAISGKPGLYKVAAQGRNNIIVQSLETAKKFPAFASDKISALEDISIYTYEEDVPLSEVYQKLAELEDYKASIHHKEPADKLRERLSEFLPDYDQDRVYDQDIRKLFQWYNILVEHGFITKDAEENEEMDESDKKLKAAIKSSENSPNKDAAEQKKAKS
ncbi:MAG: DUF5606 domain-containing protein [Flavobacteriales bacterium]|jgi:hypothetical protein|nr:DUF5606 domain-containing protein [Flavobacteriales bacterium]